MQEMLRISSWKSLAIIFALAALPFFGFAGTLSGTVVDGSGEPLPYATVWVDGTENGALTNEEGTFVLDGLSEESLSLSVDYPGFGRKSVKGLVVDTEAENEKVLIQLSENTSEMDDYTINEVEFASDLITLDPVLIYAEAPSEDRIDISDVSFKGLPMGIWVWKLFTWLKALF